VPFISSAGSRHLELNEGNNVWALTTRFFCGSDLLSFPLILPPIIAAIPKAVIIRPM
jgi:hypothetical protein